MCDAHSMLLHFCFFRFAIKLKKICLNSNVLFILLFDFICMLLSLITAYSSLFLCWRMLCFILAWCFLLLCYVLLCFALLCFHFGCLLCSCFSCTCSMCRMNRAIICLNCTTVLFQIVEYAIDIALQT